MKYKTIFPPSKPNVGYWAAEVMGAGDSDKMNERFLDVPVVIKKQVVYHVRMLQKMGIGKCNS